MLSYDDKNAELTKCFKRYFKNSKHLAHLTWESISELSSSPSKGPVAKCWFGYETGKTKWKIVI